MCHTSSFPFNHCAFVIALAVLMSGCKTPDTRVQIPVPEFSVQQVLASADQETHEKIHDQAVVVFLDRIKLVDPDARHIESSRFEMAIEPLTGGTSQVVDVNDSLVLGVTEWRNVGGRRLYVRFGDKQAIENYKPSVLTGFLNAPLVALHYHDAKRTATGLHISYGAGWQEGALEFVAACEVLGAEIDRSNNRRHLELAGTPQ
jgi:hypothetical protein